MTAWARAGTRSRPWGRLSFEVVLLGAIVVWSLNFVLTKYALDHRVQPLVWSATRMATAAACFNAFTFGVERRVRTGRRGLLAMLAVGPTALLANQLAFVYGVDLTTASTGALAFGTMPIFASLLERRAHGLRHWAAALVSFGGVALVALGARQGIGGHPLGFVLAVATPATWVVYSVAMGPWVARSSPARVNAISTLACALPFLAIASPQLASQDWGAPPPLAWAVLGASVVVSYFLGNLVWFAAVRRVGTARSSLYVNLQPFLGTLFAVLILGETLSGLQIAGGLVIAAGIVLAGRVRRQSARVDLTDDDF